MKPTLAAFIVLQLLDMGTTLAVLALGGRESNPLINYLMELGPFRGLVLSKALVIALASIGSMAGKTRGIRVANLVFSVVVAWNLTIIGRLALTA